MTTLDDNELHKRARRRVKPEDGLLHPPTVYRAGQPRSGRDQPDVWRLAPGHLWPLAGWGLGLAIHGFVTFARLRGDGLRERMLAAEIERLQQRWIG